MIAVVVFVSTRRADAALSAHSFLSRITKHVAGLTVIFRYSILRYFCYAFYCEEGDESSQPDCMFDTGSDFAGH